MPHSTPDAPPRDRQHLENSRQLPWDRTCNAAGWPVALDQLMGELEDGEVRGKKRRPDDRRRLREALGAVVLALYAAHKADEGRWLAYSRRNDDYGAEQRRYLHPDVSARAATTAVDFLTAAGFAEHRKGSYSRSNIGNRGTRSRIRARSELTAMLECDHGITPASLGFAEWSEVVRLKAAAETRGGPKRLLPYPDTILTHDMRRQLRDGNSFLSSFQIDLEPTASVAEDALSEDWNAKQAEEPVDVNDRSAVRLYRVFNNGVWDHGGRLYGGWWQGLPKALRSRLLIDGEETVELDFKALHPRLCYHLDGAPLPADSDPYSIAGLSGGALRGVLKVAFNQLLNVSGPVRLRAPEGAPAILPKGLSYAKLIAQIEQAHGPIAGWFRSGRGVALQHLDSLIASSVLGALRSRGICCLPVHDSFIVPRSAELDLGHAMLIAYRSITIQRAAVEGWPPISGWTSAEMERRAEASVAL